MTGLVIQLKPHEKFLVNGVVLQNGERRNRIRIRSKGASVLRMSEVLHPVEAITPARHLYYLAQLAVLGLADAEETRLAIAERLPSLQGAYDHADARALVSACQSAVAAGKMFAVMRALRKLFPFDGAPSAFSAPAK